MKSLNGTKAVRFLIASLLGLLFAVSSPFATAQVPNPTPPGNLGGFDNYGNQYPILGKQYFHTGSWSFPGCFIPGSTVTLTLASPGVVNVANNCIAGQQVFFNSTGALPTGLTVGTTYYVISTGLSGSSFEVSTSAGGGASNFTGTQSGIQTATSNYANGTTSYTAAITTSPVPPGFTVPGHCTVIWQTSNTSGTIKLGLNVNNATASATVFNTAYYGSGGATVAQLYTLVGAGSSYATPTDISAATTATSANTSYRDDIYFLLYSVSSPTSVSINALSSSSSYTISLMPGSYCVIGQ